MGKQVDFELVQDKYTNFILYDGSIRSNLQVDWINIDEITKVELVFTDKSDELKENKNYIIDFTKKAIHNGNKTFTYYDFSGYDKEENMRVIINGVTYDILVDSYIMSIDEMVNVIQSFIPDEQANVYNDGDKISISTRYTGLDQVIQVVGGTLADRIGWRVGIYRGNDWEWNSSLAEQKDMFFYIYPQDLGFSDTIPDTRWLVEIHVEYNGVIPITTEQHNFNLEDYWTKVPATLSYQTNYTEFSYKITEIYRAKIFEHISKNFKKFEKVEQRTWDTLEQTMYSILQFDAVYASFKAAMDAGLSDTSYELLNYLINYRNTNSIK